VLLAEFLGTKDSKTLLLGVRHNGQGTYRCKGICFGAPEAHPAADLPQLQGGIPTQHQQEAWAAGCCRQLCNCCARGQGQLPDHCCLHNADDVYDRVSTTDRLQGSKRRQGSGQACDMGCMACVAGNMPRAGGVLCGHAGQLPLV
jgi:hypothetical protein